MVFSIVILALISEITKTKDVDWNESYRINDKNPFGLYLFSKLVSDLFPDKKISIYSKSMYEYLLENRKAQFDDSFDNYPKNFIIIANKTKFGKSEFEDLKTILSDGNNVFIASENFGWLENQLRINLHSWNFFYPDLINTTNKSKEIRFISDDSQKDSNYSVPIGNNSYFNLDSATNVITVIAESIYQKPVFISNDIYGGKLYLFSIPTTFTNINILDKNHIKLAEKTLSVLENYPTVIIDMYSDGTKANSPLRFILSNESLSMAYYVSIFGLIMFFLFAIKRKQRIIPELKMNTNSSIEFISTIAKLTYVVKNNKEIATKKINSFYKFIHNKLNLQLNLNHENFIELLSGKSGINPNILRHLFSIVEQTNKLTTVNDKQLELLCSEIENFYKKVNL